MPEASPCRIAATTSMGQAINAASRPRPWLTLFAISSPRDCGRSCGSENRVEVIFVVCELAAACCNLRRLGGARASRDSFKTKSYTAEAQRARRKKKQDREPPRRRENRKLEAVRLIANAPHKL